MFMSSTSSLKGAIEALNVAVLSWFAFLYKNMIDARVFAKDLKIFCDKLSAVVCSDIVRFTSPFNNSFNQFDNFVGWKRILNFNGKSFSIVIIQDIERSEFSPIFKAVFHKINTPG